MFYWFMKNLVAGPLIKTVFRPWIIGLENIPKTGGVILASNHLSDLSQDVICRRWTSTWVRLLRA